MLDRYTKLEMRELWSEYNRFYHLLLVEFAALKARHELGEIEEEIPDDLVNTIKIDVEEINRIEREITKHDVSNPGFIAD
jgi:adenylosuccinate lyase